MEFLLIIVVIADFLCFSNWLRCVPTSSRSVFLPKQQFNVVIYADSSFIQPLLFQMFLSPITKM